MKKIYSLLALLPLSTMALPAFAQSTWLGKWRNITEGLYRGEIIEFTEFDGI